MPLIRLAFPPDIHQKFGLKRLSGVPLLSMLLALAALQTVPAAPAAGPRDRVTARIDNTRRFTVRGTLHPKATADHDEGPADASLTLPDVTLVLKQSAAQQAELDKLLAEQQDPTSPNYHRWLTPEQYAERFGVSQDDLNKLTSWLKDQNLSVTAVARGRNSVSVKGTAGAIRQAFHAEIHNYRVDGETHYANATEPTVPVAFEPIVGAIRGLNNFRLKPPPHTSRAVPGGTTDAVQPQYNSSKGSHYLAPDDLATIYNIKPLYNAGIDGSGQKIVVVGQTQIDLADIQQFRTFFNLPANDPQVMFVPNSRNPGTRKDDMGEADLDLEWAGAVARNATLIYVYAYDVMTAAQYAIDQNLAPVMSISYGSCEAQNSSSEALALQTWAKQANAQGMTWFAASGDSGGLDCVGGSSSRYASTLSVDIPAAIPEVTGVGGTTFNEGSGSYWNATADANRASAIGYIPEVAWNDSDSSGPSSSGGGASTMFAKPSWQAGMGVPADGARDVPDVSLSASAAHDAYIVFSGGTQQAFGGTSAGSPSFAGIAALLNHYLISNGTQAAAGVGNMNPRLYDLAQSTPSAFHDVISGDNIITATCSGRVSSCTPGSYGFQTGAGYDQVTGLGSVDAYNLVTAWSTAPGSSPAALAGTSFSVNSSTANIGSGGSTTLTATVAGAGGVTPTGTVSFSSGGAALGSATLSGSGGIASASTIVNGSQLQSGSNTITASYSGDSSYRAATASTVVTVQGTQSGPPSISGIANGASFTPTFAPGMVVSIFGSRLAQATQSASAVPLPFDMGGTSVTVNGYPAPLYYASPSQLNVQVPYEIQSGSTAMLTVTVSGQRTSKLFEVGYAAPGIFTDQNSAPVPSTNAARGSIATLFITGAGAVTPYIATGSAPFSSTPLMQLPVPVQSVYVTVGAVRAPIQFIGITPGLVGVMQINYRVPDTISTGNRQVVVTIGGVPSAAATLRVTQ